MDCTVRLWTQEGHYIGTFGQPTAWNIYDSASFQHPMVPYDVLVDPLSLPTQLQSEEAVQTERTISKLKKPAENTVTFSLPNQPSQPVLNVDDETIADQIKRQLHRRGQGKRLRHEILKPSIMDTGGPSNYQHLVCFDLEQPPKFNDGTARKRQSYLE